jgi:hypothetical protein
MLAYLASKLHDGDRDRTSRLAALKDEVAKIEKDPATAK